MAEMEEPLAGSNGNNSEGGPQTSENNNNTISVNTNSMDSNSTSIVDSGGEGLSVKNNAPSPKSKVSSGALAALLAEKEELERDLDVLKQAMQISEIADQVIAVVEGAVVKDPLLNDNEENEWKNRSGAACCCIL